MIPSYLHQYLRKSCSLGNSFIESRQVATLKISSGEIVACDPLVFPETSAFKRRVPKGDFPVVVSLATLPDGDERVAAARIEFVTGSVSKWEPALLPAQDPAKLTEGENFGYGVDAGTGCFMDLQTALVFIEREKEMSSSPEFGSYYDDVLSDPLEENSRSSWTWLNHCPADDDRNVVMFSSGWGDGVYSSYWGLDGEGEVVCLLTEFDVVDLEPPPAKDESSSPGFVGRLRRLLGRVPS